MNQQLNAVTKAKTAYVMAKTSLEAKLREQLQEELRSLQTQVDIATRIAYNSGESKAALLRALGTKDYHTVNAILARTEGVEEIVGDDPLADVYQWVGDKLIVTYDNHGPAGITATAEFTVQKAQDTGEWMFNPLTPLWNEDWTVKNDAVAQLGGRFEGFYYEEASAWVTNSNAL